MKGLCNCPWPTDRPGVGAVQQYNIPGLYYAWCDHCEYKPGIGQVSRDEAVDFILDHLVECCPKWPPPSGIRRA